MQYGFVKEDLQWMEKENPFYLQAEYAKAIGGYVEIDLAQSCLKNAAGERIDVIRDKWMLRASCETAVRAISFAEEHGLEVVETNADIGRIERWHEAGIAKRKLLAVPARALLGRPDHHEQLGQFLETQPCVFVKSLNKGFSAVVPSNKLGSGELDAFLRKQCEKHHVEMLLIAEYLEVAEDSLGKKEVRFFVFEHEILNASRTLHSLKHHVQKKFFEKAKEVVCQLRQMGDFPSNYVLDLAEFKRGTEKWIDVLEVNPVTTSLCYVNNSVFETKHADICAAYDWLGMGYEYCLDYTRNPERYVLNRGAGERYEYENPQQYDFRNGGERG